jgi:oxalate decarboxylase/phosphoglucose isomerase-like protein (cupin superfamily)
MNLFAVLFCILAVFFSNAWAQRSALLERQKFKAEDFVFNYNSAIPTVTEGGSGKALNVDNRPILQGLGVSSAMFDILPCGIVTPHIHPRGTELYHLLKGSLLVGILEENGGRYIENNVTMGQVAIVPMGLLHYVQNLGCTNTTFLATFSSEDPGTLTVAPRMFTITNTQVLTSTFNQSESVIESLRASVRPAPSAGVGECRRRCGLPPVSCAAA